MGFQKKLIEIKPKSLYEEEDSFYIVQKNNLDYRQKVVVLLHTILLCGFY